MNLLIETKTLFAVVKVSVGEGLAPRFGFERIIAWGPNPLLSEDEYRANTPVPWGHDGMGGLEPIEDVYFFVDTVPPGEIEFLWSVSGMVDPFCKEYYPEILEGPVAKQDHPASVLQ